MEKEHIDGIARVIIKQLPQVDIETAWESKHQAFLQCELIDRNGHYMASSFRPRVVITLDAITQTFQNENKTTVFPRELGDSLFCLVENKNEFDIVEKGTHRKLFLRDRVICGPKEKVIEYDKEHS